MSHNWHKHLKKECIKITKLADDQERETGKYWQSTYLERKMLKTYI